jgi:hypothetical protein
VEKFMQITKHFVLALVLFVAPAALADSFQFTINSSVPITISNSAAGEDIYESPVNGHIQTGVGASGIGGILIPNSSLSFTAPQGTAITSATLTLTIPQVVYGTAVLFTGSSFSPPDIDQPRSAPPVLDNPGTATIQLFAVLGSNTSDALGISECDVCDVSNYLAISGNTVSMSNNHFPYPNINVIYSADMHTDVAVQATNWAGFIDGVASGDIPYALQLSGTYAVTPEPSSALLMMTGVIGLCGYMYRNKAGRMVS